MFSLILFLANSYLETTSFCRWVAKIKITIYFNEKAVKLEAPINNLLFQFLNKTSIVKTIIPWFMKISTCWCRGQI